jgi:hypothetical protein
MKHTTKGTTMAKKPSTTQHTDVESAMLALADFIYQTFGNVTTAAPVPGIEEDEEVAPEVVDVEESDVVTEEEVDLDAERAALMKETITRIRERLIDAGFDASEIKNEKSKGTLVDAFLADKYGEDEDEGDEDDEEFEEDTEVEETEEETEDTDEDDDEDDEDDEDEEEGEDEDDDEEDDEESDEDEPYTEDELAEMSLAELKEIAAEWEVEVKSGTRAKGYVKAILEAQEAMLEESDDEDEDDEEEVTREDLEALSLSDLRKAAKEDYGIPAADLKGLDKDAIIDLLFEDEGDDDEEDEADDADEDEDATF